MRKLISRAQLTAHVAPKQGGRYSVAAIQFDDRGAVSTDGKMLLVIPYPAQEALAEVPAQIAGAPSDESTAVTVPLNTIDRAAKNLPKRQSRPVLECAVLASNGDSVSIASTDLDSTVDVTGKAHEATFPDYGFALGTLEKPATFCLSLEVLRSLLDAAKKTHAEYCTFHHTDATSSIGFRLQGEGEIEYGFGVMMPVKCT